MKRFSIALLSVALVLMFAASALADHPVNICDSPRITRKVDSGLFLIDQSGSMMMTHAAYDLPKLELAKTAAGRVNDAIPDLGYAIGANTFAAFAKLVDVAPYGLTQKGLIGKAIGGVKSNQAIFGRFTPMGQDLASAAQTVKGMPGKAAVILVTDGESNMGPNPIDQAKALYAAAPNAIIHIISVADSKEGAANLAAIKALNANSVLYNATDIANNQALADKFVQDVFYNCPPELVLKSVQFELGSAAITPASAAILNEAAKLLKDYEGSFKVVGNTCSLGSDASNQTLSERRAASVKNYLVNRGISANRLTPVGLGESQPKYDNSTDQGRRMNRRVDFVNNKTK